MAETRKATSERRGQSCQKNQFMPSVDQLDRPIAFFEASEASKQHRSAQSHEQEAAASRQLTKSHSSVSQSYFLHVHRARRHRSSS